MCEEKDVVKLIQVVLESKIEEHISCVDTGFNRYCNTKEYYIVNREVFDMELQKLLSKRRQSNE